MSKHKKKAIDLFNEGYNCSQSTFLAFSNLLEGDFDEMARISSSFGGGMGKMKEVCGALTGAFMAIGAKLGYDDPKDKEAKEKHYALIREVARRFEAEKGSIFCRDLLEFNKERPKTEVTDETLKQCGHYVAFAARLVDEVLEETSL